MMKISDATIPDTVTAEAKRKAVLQLQRRRWELIQRETAADEDAKREQAYMDDLAATAAAARERRDAAWSEAARVRMERIQLDATLAALEHYDRKNR